MVHSHRTLREYRPVARFTQDAWRFFYSTNFYCLLGALERVCDRDRNFVALNDDFRPGNRRIVGEDPNFVMLRGIELNHRAAPHAQQLLHLQLRAA